jgi:hypothetical protein
MIVDEVVLWPALFIADEDVVEPMGGRLFDAVVLVVPCPASLVADEVKLPLDIKLEAPDVEVLGELEASPDAELPMVAVVDCVYELDVI